MPDRAAVRKSLELPKRLEYFWPHGITNAEAQIGDLVSWEFVPYRLQFIGYQDKGKVLLLTYAD